MAVVWEKSLSLDRTSENYNNFLNANRRGTIPYHKTEFQPIITQNNTFLHAQKLRQNLNESRKAFLNLSPVENVIITDCIEEKLNENVIQQLEQKKTPSKKISFKIKKSSSIYRRNPQSTAKITISANKVAELTKKFNQLMTEKVSILEEPKFRKLVKRVNSQRSVDSDHVKLNKKPIVPSVKPKEITHKVSRKPSVKTKPSFSDDKNIVIIRKQYVQHKLNNKKSDSVIDRTNNDNKLCVKAKIGYLETLHSVEEHQPIRPTTLELNNTPQKIEMQSQLLPSQISPTNGAVRATIEKFERKTSECSSPGQIITKEVPKLVPKPKVPEKKFNLNIKSKEIEAKNNKIKTILKQSANDTNIINSGVTEQNIDNTNSDYNRITENIPIEIKIEKTDFEEDTVQILNIPAILPQRRCDSMYETLNLKKFSQRSNVLKISKSEEIITNIKQPPEKNNSFLWSKCPGDKSPSQSYKTDFVDDITNNGIRNNSIDDSYDIVEPPEKEEIKPTEIVPDVPPRPTSLTYQKPKTTIIKKKMPLPDDKIYEELQIRRDEDNDSHNYEYCRSSAKYEDVEPKSENDYEYCAAPSNENIYETLPVPPLLPKRQLQEPLPPRPPSRSSYCTIRNEDGSNCYESIYNPESKREVDTEVESNYESIYGLHIKETGSNRDSLVSSDQQSNSLYGRSFNGWNEDIVSHYNGKATSDLSSSDRSDDWVDMSDNEDITNTEFIIVREKHKSKKSGWAKQCREQFTKSPRKLQTTLGVDSDSDHHYETLTSGEQQEPLDDDYDSFDDTDSESSYTKVNLNDSGVDIGNNQLPEPPNNQAYVLTRLAATAGKHMRKLRRNWSLTKNDITKSISRMTKRKSRTDLDCVGESKKEEKSKDDKSPIIAPKSNVVEAINPRLQIEIVPPPNMSYQNLELSESQSLEQTDSVNTNEKTKSLSRKGFLNKWRRSMSMSTETANEVTVSLNKPKSTFYLTEAIDVDTEKQIENEVNNDSGVSLSPAVQRNNKSSNLNRPQSPPPPTPLQNNEPKKPERKDKRSTSWYAEAGLFRNSDNNQNARRTSTFWYAEVGLYNGQTQQSTPSTSSTENSGNNISNIEIKPVEDFINQDNSEEYYNMKNENDYYNDSIKSFSSNDTRKDQSTTNLSADNQLRLQDEPLYQFYDAAVLESVCHDGTSDIDSDGYEEVGNKRNGELRLSTRPSAMELVTPKRNSFAFTKTLWCEIPEVIQSSVLSTLNSHQRKIQEAKFEMITSEASYLNSLNVLHDHFITSLQGCSAISQEEIDILFGKVAAVKECSEKLISDLEKCWQDNILLHGVCEIIQKHAEENFAVYISYCENQIILDDTLKKVKERQNFYELLTKLETGSACQSLTLYSFLMLPMQRVTRWPLLVDAVLKRLSPQDNEYLTCQYALATLNKIVNQCNEAARMKERENEMKVLSKQLEFAKGVQPIEIMSLNRWLIRSGMVTHMQMRTDETKLTFGKKFTKVPLHLFLFNDLLLVAKSKSENSYAIIHYCPRNIVELSSTDMIVSLPIKEAQSRNLIFLTILENQDEKTIELLLSCNSESDKERWVEALTPPKSDDPDETLYECWDCPQVTAIHSYNANQPDELALSRGDVINVLRKMIDGWYNGERIRDGQIGWFPANYTVEIANPHVRARNLKQRYRLLAFSENYLKSK